MRYVRLGLSIAIVSLFSLQTSFAANQLDELNDVAVQDLNNKKYDAAIESFEKIMRVNPDYPRARKTLASAHNELGLLLSKSSWREALAEFHKSYYLDPVEQTKTMIADALIAMGKSPNSALERSQLADDADSKGDLIGAYTESYIAYQIDKNPQTKTKLDAVLNRIQKETQLPAPAVAKVVPVSEVAVKLLSPQSTSESTNSDWDSNLYMNDLQTKLKKTWLPTTNKNSNSAHFVCRFRLLNDGSVESPEVIESSGNTEIDNTGLSAIKAAAPYAPLPPDAGKDNLISASFFGADAQYSLAPHAARRAEGRASSKSTTSTSSLEVPNVNAEPGVNQSNAANYGLYLNPNAPVPIIAEIPDPNNINKECSALFKHGNQCFYARDYVGARTIYQKAFDLAQSKGHELEQILALVYLHSALDKIDLSEATSLYKAHLALPRKYPDNCWSQKFLFEYAGNLWTSKEYAQSKSLYDEALTDYKQHPALDPSNIVRFLGHYAGLLTQLNDIDGVIKLKDWAKFQKLIIIDTADITAASNSGAKLIGRSSPNWDGHIYMDTVQVKLKRMWRPKGDTSGTSIWRFRILQDGTLEAPEIFKSSGNNDLDNTGLMALKESTPFDPLPPEAGKSAYIQFKFEYNVAKKGESNAARNGMYLNQMASTPPIAPIPDPNKVNNECNALLRQGSACWKAKDYAGSRALYQKAFAIAQTKGDELEQLLVLLNLHSAINMIDRSDATLLYKSHLMLPRKHSDHCWGQKYLFEYAGDLWATKQHTQAKAIYSEAYNDYKRHPALPPSNAVQFLGDYVGLLIYLNENEEAKKVKDWAESQKLITARKK